MVAFLVKWTVGERSYDLHQQKLFINHKDAVDFVESLKRSHEDCFSKLKSVSILNELRNDFDSKYKGTAIKVGDCIDALQDLKDKLIKEEPDASRVKCLQIDNSIESLLNVVNSVLDY